MQTTQSYINGQWTQGSGEGQPIFDSITGEHFTNVSIEGLNIPEILAYGSYFDGIGEFLFLLSVNGATGKRAVFRLYDPETTSGYFAYSLKPVNDQFMIYGFLTNPNTGLIAFLDDALNVLWSKKISPFEANGATIISRDKDIIARSGKYLFKMDLMQFIYCLAEDGQISLK